MEKRGYANFKVVNQKTDEFFYVDNDDFLSSFQQKQMSFQPDFMLEYAHYLADQFQLTRPQKSGDLCRELRGAQR